MSPQNVLGCPACGMRITGTESECPRCHQVFDQELRFECPFCGGLIPKGSERCPTCQIDLRKFAEHDHHTVKQRTDDILEELIQLESSLIKQEQKKYYCPDCSWLLSGTETKCPKCGRALEGDGSLKCPICMSNIRVNAVECEKCGAILRNKEVVPDKAPLPPPPPARKPPVAEKAKPTLKELDSLLKCPHCNAAVSLEATICPRCGKSVVQGKVAAPPPEQTSADMAAVEALETLGQIEKEARGPRTRKLKPGKVTTVEKRPGESGRGFSNGLGQINGTSMVNGRSKINGTGRVNGTGAVNGRSLVNGKGMSNGLKAKASSLVGRNRFAVKWQFVVLLVAVVVIIPAFIYLANLKPAEPIKVDGDFSDWSSVNKFGARTMSGSPSIDIAEWATLESGSSVYLYARMQQAPMASDQAESYFLFIDSDGAPETGYAVEGIGADYLMEFIGWNESVQSASLLARNDVADQYDWNAWTDTGSCVARVEGTQVEAKSVLPEVPSASTRYLLMSKDSDDRSSISYAAPSKGGLLVVELEPSADVATDGVVASANPVSLLNARFTCQGSGGTVNAISPELSGATGAAPSLPFSLSPGMEHVVVITVDSSSSSSGQLLTANLLSSGIESDFDAVQIVGGPVGAYVALPPQEILIDGAFGDWTGKTTIDQDSSPVENADIDIDSTGNYSTPESSYFYVSVKGELVKGDAVPADVRKPSGAGGGEPVTPTRRTGEDVLRIYIDSDLSQSTGLACWYGSKVIGADHKIEISGVNGHIVSSTYWNYSSGHWVESAAGVLSAKDSSRIEISVSSGLIGGRSDVDFIVETTCWKDEFDRASYNPSGTRALTARISGNAHIEAWLGGISTSPTATSMSYQRKLFWDGTNFWSFYFDGSDTIYKYSDTGGTTWTSVGTVFKTAGVDKTSIWYDSSNNVVYAVGDRSAASTSVYLQKGTVTPSSHTITWAASDSTVATSANSLAAKNTFISRDASGYIWVMSVNYTGTTPSRYDLSAFKSTTANSISGSWTCTGSMLLNSAQSSLKGSAVPAGTGSNMWSIYVNAGQIGSKKYTGSWGAESVLYTPTGLGANTEDAPPSALVDANGVFHVIYGNDHEQPVGTSKPHIYYMYNTGSSWSAALALSSTAANNGFKYPTISLDTSTGNLYAFWYDMQTKYVAAKKNVSGTWSTITLNAQTANTKAYLTSIYSAPGASYICYQWTQNSTAPIHVIFDRIPEFGDTLVPVFSAAAVCAFAIMIDRRRSRRPDDDGAAR